MKNKSKSDAYIGHKTSFQFSLIVTLSGNKEKNIGRQER